MPHSKAPPPVGILQLTDFHLLPRSDQRFYGISTWQSLKDTLAEALRQNPAPDLVLLTGDLAQNACPETYALLKPLIEEIPAPTLVLPGNHDSPALLTEAFSWSRKVRERIRCLQGWIVIALDSCTPGSPVGNLSLGELRELASVLQETRTQPVLIALHHPPIATGSRWLDTMQISNSREFKDLIAQYPNVRALVFGHIHQTWRSAWGETQLMGTPSTGFQFAPLSDTFRLDLTAPGYRWITLYSDGSVKSTVGRLKALPEGLDPTAKGY